jgi:maltooligosyltrehalose trehalohydrolase
LRLDAVHAFADASAVPFLEQLAVEVEALEGALERPLILIAESDLNDPRLLRSREAGGFGLHGQWSDDFHHALHAWLTGERQGYYADFGCLGDLARACENAFVYDGRYSAFRRRRHGRSPAGISGQRFVAYAQNHDQVGNRARGERLSALVSAARLKCVAALLLTAPFVPLLFQGEEWGAATPFPFFSDHDDPRLARAVSEGRRREFAAFGWRPEDVADPQDPRTFATARLDWDERAREPHASLLRWHHDLIALRRRVPELRDGRRERTQPRYDERGAWLTYERGPLTIASSFATEARRIPLNRPHERVALASSERIQWDATEVTLPPDAVAILEAGS